MQEQLQEIIIPAQTNSHKNNLYCFLGGLILNLFFINSTTITAADWQSVINYIFSTDFVNYLIRSVIGGFIALVFKLILDVIARRIAKKHNKKGGQHE